MQSLKFSILILLSLPLLALAHDTNPHGDLIIRMTKNGFEPKDLTVTAGDEVLFINNDDANRWPASNLHPTHEVYPEFDSMTGIKPGSSWKMEFENPGVWRMHDHLFPHFTGTITVLESTTTEPVSLENEDEIEIGFFEKIKTFFHNIFRKIFSKSSINEFKDLSEREKYEWLETFAEEESPQAAWGIVKNTYNTPEGAVGTPHDMAHLVGQLIFEKHGLQGLSICDPSFGFGCYHGLMEVALDKDKPENYLENFFAARDGCKVLGDDSSPMYWSCIHGIGHGVATYREHDLDKALEDCDMLNKEVRTYCHDGVFMEFLNTAPGNFYRKEDPVYPCSALLDSYKGACIRNQVKVMSVKFVMNTEEIYEKCMGTKNSFITNNCIDSLGLYIAQDGRNDPQMIIAGCQEIINVHDSAQCMAAAAGELVFQNYAGWKSATNEICLSLDSLGESACRERVEEIRQSYGR